jgi:hypothetical protein
MKSLLSAAVAAFLIASPAVAGNHNGGGGWHGSTPGWHGGPYGYHGSYYWGGHGWVCGWGCGAALLATGALALGAVLAYPYGVAPGYAPPPVVYAAPPQAYYAPPPPALAVPPPGYPPQAYYPRPACGYPPYGPCY